VPGAARRRRRPGRTQPAVAVAAACWAVALPAALAGCATARPPVAPLSGLTASGPAAAWRVPAEALGSQRLYRVHYDGPDGEGSLRVTLRLTAADRYRAQAADALGRSVWSLEVTGQDAVWIDHRQRRACRLRGEVSLAGLPLAPFPLPALPPLLLGRLPAAPAPDRPPQEGPVATGGDGTALTFHDRRGRRWTAELVDGAPVRWALWDEDAGRPRVTWLRQGGEAVLTDLEAGVQIRWREVVVEPLAEAPPPLAVPPGYTSDACPPPI
jgi:hypothetical protein